MPPRGLASLAALGLLLAPGCRPSGGDDGPSTEAGDEAGDSSTGDVPDPAFLNPALGEFVVESTQHVPKDIVVRAITLGNTELLVDGQSAGTLGPGSALGELTGDRLRLFLHGALTQGAHSLQLASSSAEGFRYSATLTMVVGPPDEAPPALRVDLVPDPLDLGDDLLLAGTGAQGLLGVVSAGADPTLRLYRAEADGWAAAPVIETTLTGHVFEAMSFGTTVSALALPPADGELVALRVAYRRGLPGDAIVTRDLALAPKPDVGPLQTAVDLSAAMFDHAEFAELGRPFLLGDALFAEFLAADDSETPHPGDRGLAHVRRRLDASGWSAPERVSTPGQLDLDALGPVLNLPDPTRTVGLSVRSGQRVAGMLTVSDAGAALVSLDPDELPLLPGTPSALTTLVSGLGTRTVAVATPDQGVGLAFLGTTGMNKSASLAAPAKKLPDARVTAPPAAGVALGFSVFLLPYGDAAPVHAVLGEGSRIYVTPLTLPEPLHCRTVVLLPSLGGNDDGAAGLPLACLDGGVLRVGVLAVDTP